MNSSWKKAFSGRSCMYQATSCAHFMLRTLGSPAVRRPVWCCHDLWSLKFIWPQNPFQRTPVRHTPSVRHTPNWNSFKNTLLMKRVLSHEQCFQGRQAETVPLEMWDCFLLSAFCWKKSPITASLERVKGEKVIALLLVCQPLIHTFLIFGFSDSIERMPRLDQ